MLDNKKFNTSNELCLRNSTSGLKWKIDLFMIVHLLFFNEAYQPFKNEFLFQYLLERFDYAKIELEKCITR